jgi:kojibiose phosphorylase
VYMLPFFSWTNPAGARTLLMYRYDTIEGARRKAKANGHRGAQYAWESADTGEETCPQWLRDPATGRPIRIWCGDLQDHISADVPYAIDQYVRITGDKAFLWEQGAEIFFETARFWSSRVTRTRDGSYEIRDSLGPDEFHVHVDDDAFTNYLAQWNLEAAANLCDDAEFPKDKKNEIFDRIDLQPEEPEGWREIARNLVLLEDEQIGLIQQHNGFFERPEVSRDIMSLPRRVPITDIIGAGMAIESQVLKQAEVVIMQTMLEGRFSRESREVNFDYYEPRTSHDSSLSVSAHAWAAARLDRIDQACAYLRRALYLDLNDLAGNTADGLHTANMGGVWLTIALGLAGLELKEGAPIATPQLPAGWKGMRLRVAHGGRKYVIDCRPNQATVEQW